MCLGELHLYLYLVCLSFSSVNCLTNVLKWFDTPLVDVVNVFRRCVVMSFLISGNNGCFSSLGVRPMTISRIFCALSFQYLS